MKTLEDELLNIDQLADYKKSAPIKTSEEIRLEWLAKRLGKFTTSGFHKLLAYPAKNELPKGAITYTTLKVVEVLTVQKDDSYISAEMQWGMDNELGAVEEFSKLTGIKKIDYIGDNQQFLTLGDDVGGTPDGLIEDYAGIEIKCPNSITHFNYMEISDAKSLKTIKPEYYWQIQGLMMITKRKQWYFVSYDPRFKNLTHKIHVAMILEHKKDQQFLKKRLAMAVELKKHMLKRVA